jgi:hypothetical protein
MMLRRNARHIVVSLGRGKRFSSPTGGFIPQPRDESPAALIDIIDGGRLFRHA